MTVGHTPTLLTPWQQLKDGKVSELDDWWNCHPIIVGIQHQNREGRLTPHLVQETRRMARDVSVASSPNAKNPPNPIWASDRSLAVNAILYACPITGTRSGHLLTSPPRFRNMKPAGPLVRVTGIRQTETLVQKTFICRTDSADRARWNVFFISFFFVVVGNVALRRVVFHCEFHSEASA